ncbi:MAG: SAM-dependent chlorinase/fluorinase [Flavobacteriaceae bacterium]|nr:SAM-dependent chlorinase/fluorinase [Flavobacteriaceae bacterium]
MPIITLTTDFGTKDPYLSAVKGRIYSQVDNANIVDISNEINPFNITEAAYVIKNAYQHFPEGSIHIVGLNVERNQKTKHLIVQYNKHYFICADNGIISLIFDHDSTPDQIIAIETEISTNFPVLDIFCPIVCKIHQGTPIEILGNSIDEITELSLLNATVNDDQNQITGNIIYIDHYGNIVTNITKSLFDTVARGRSADITARSYTFHKIYKSFADFSNEKMEAGFSNYDGERLALFNSADYLQISIYKGNKNKGGTAFSLLGLYPESTTVTVNFK